MKGGKCYRKACNNQPAVWYNHSTREHYCEACAMTLNKIHHIEANKLYGHELCTLSDSGSRLLSPNDLFAAAKQVMLEGREPESRKDQLLIMNFIVVNIHVVVRPSACKLLNEILNMGLQDSDILEIIEYHRPFAVMASLPMRSYYVKESADGLLPNQLHGLQIVMSKFDTREEADDFQKHCQDHPRRELRFLEMITLLRRR